MTAPARFEDGGVTMMVRTDWTTPGGALAISMHCGPVALLLGISRDEVRDLVQALDDWLYESRPS